VTAEFVSAAEEIASRAPMMARAVAAIGPPRLRPPADTYFLSLVRSISFQQLAGPAAAAIYGRFVVSLEGVYTPEQVVALPETAFRTAGLSAAKTASIRDLAGKVLDGTVPLDQIEALTDDEIVSRLSLVRGIGRWTAEMFLIFQLRRPDVWPVDDLAVRKGYAVIHRLEVSPAPKELLPLGEPYRPFRTVAAWYCWRATDTVLPDV
jgi:DNA-3-methyladenine glycosylase II